MDKKICMLIILLVFATTLFACTSADSRTEDNLTLDSATWRLSALHGQAVLEGSEVTAVFDPDEGSINGLAGCNNYFAEYTVDGMTLVITAPGATSMICAEPDGIMQQEDTYLPVLDTAVKYQIRGDRLEIMNSAREQILIFVVRESG